MSGPVYELPAGSTVDRFLGGRIVLVQPGSGHRAGLDAALLQALVPAGARGTAVDLGTGCGAVALCVAARSPAMRVIGIDVDARILAYAHAGLCLEENATVCDRVRYVEFDVAARRNEREAAGLTEGIADFVLMNPPFDRAETVRASPNPARRRAHVTTADASIESWSRTAAALAKAGGTLALIQRASSLAVVLSSLAGRFGGLNLRAVHPRASANASRILVTGVRGSRAPLSLLPPLVLHNDDGSWTEIVEAILSGWIDLAGGIGGAGQRRAE